MRAQGLSSPCQGIMMSVFGALGGACFKQVYFCVLERKCAPSSTEPENFRESRGRVNLHSLPAADGAYRERVHGHVPAAGSAGAGS